MTKQDSANLNTILLIIGIAIISIAAFTLPIDSKHKDVYIKFTIEQPLDISLNQPPPQFTAVEAYSQPHTLIATPIPASLLSSGTIVVTAETNTVKGKTTVGQIYRSDSKEGSLILKNVPVSENQVIVKLIENNIQKDQVLVVLS